MEDSILQEVRKDVFENPKSTIDLDYLYSVKRQIQGFADNTNSQLKKNVYQNYSLFIESSREISTLKEEMKQLNIILEQQQASLNKLLDQENNPIIQPNIERPREFVYNIPSGDVSETEAETFPAWFTKSPEDFDVLIAQKNLSEAVDLALKVRNHIKQYPAVSGRPDLMAKIESRKQELVASICAELKPVDDRTVQGGPRSSKNSIQLLRKLNLSAKAVQLYLDQRSSVLRFILNQQKVESTTSIQFIKQLCSTFFHNTVETCDEFKKAFEVEENVENAIDESRFILDLEPETKDLLFDRVRNIYSKQHPSPNHSSPLSNTNGNDITSRLFNQSAERIADNSLGSNRRIFHYLSTYASLTNWIVQEFENLTRLFRQHVFDNPQLTISTVAESVHHLRNQCLGTAREWGIDMSEFIERELADQINKVIDESQEKLEATIKKLDKEEKWQPQQFENKAQLKVFIDEMNNVKLDTMSKYIFEDLKLRFTACKTSFARFYLITVRDLAMLISPTNKSRIDNVLARTFEMEMDSVVDALKKAKVGSKARFIMANSNFLLDKVVVVAQDQYKKTTRQECDELAKIQSKYHAEIKSVAKIWTRESN